MIRTYFFKSIKINNRFFCTNVVSVSNNCVNSYEIAESEEINIQKVEADRSNSSPNKKVEAEKSKWGDVTIDME